MAKGRPENLVPFKKGKDERRNDYGANAGSQSLGSILDRLLAKRIKTVDEGGAIEVTRKEAIAIEMIKSAIYSPDPNVQLKAAKMIFDTTDPLPKDVNLNIGNIEGDTELSPEQAAKIAKIVGG